MLRTISWSDYIIAVTILLAIYYLFVGVRYFSEEIKDLLSAKHKPKLRTVVHDVNIITNPGDRLGQQEIAGYEKTTDDKYTEMEHLIERLKAVIADASSRKLIPQELRIYLSKVLKDYPAVRYSTIRSSVNELIISELQKYGVVTFKVDELELLWEEAV